MTMEMMNEAMHYRACGFSVIPLFPDGSKESVVPWTCFAERLADEQEIKAWFDNTDNRLGIVCGAVSGNTLVVDFEVKAFHDKFMASMEIACPSLHEKLSQSLLVTTYKGLHLYLKTAVPPPRNQTLAMALLPIIKDDVDEKWKVGTEWYVRLNGKEYPTVQVDGTRYARTVAIETRGEGWYVQAPPSTGYQVASGGIEAIPVLEREEVEQLFSIARSLSDEHPTKFSITEGKEDGGNAGERPGDRYNQSADICDLLGKHGWTVSGTVAERTYLTRPGKASGVSATYNIAGTKLLYVFSRNASPFERNCAYTAFAARTLLEFKGDYAACARQLVEEGQRSNNPTPMAPDGEWEPPIPLRADELPAFPTDIFPTGVRRFVQGAAHSIQVPVDLMGMLVLGVSATLCSKVAVVEVKSGYSEPLNLYLCGILPPGSRKSAAFKQATRPLVQLEAQLQDDEREALQRSNNRRAILTGRRQELVKRLQQEDDDEAQQALDTIEQQLATLSAATKTTLWADDITPESLALLLAQNRGKMSVMSAEGGVFDMMAGRYSNGTNLDVYLKGHAGDVLRVNRKGVSGTNEDGYTVNDPALTIAVTVQPQVLQGLTSKGAMLGRGLMARFLYCYPEDLAGHRLVDTQSIPADALAAYHCFVHVAGSWRAEVDARGEAVPHEIGMSPQAQRLRNEFAYEIDRRMARGQDLDGLKDWANKLTGQCVRIAGLLHLLEHADQQTAWTHAISLETMQHAIDLGRYFIVHAKRAYADMHANPEDERAQTLLGWILARNLSQFAARDVQRNVNALRDSNDLKPALARLQEHGYIRPAQAAGKGNKTLNYYEVNPATFEQSEARRVVAPEPVPLVADADLHMAKETDRARTHDEDDELLFDPRECLMG